MFLGKSPMSSLVRKLSEIGGDGPFKSVDWRIRVRLNWHHKAKSAVRHILEGVRKIDLDEAAEIEAAHLKWCAEKVEANRDENRKLFDAMRKSIEAMEQGDSEFYRPHIEAVRDLLLQHGNVSGQAGSEG